MTYDVVQWREENLLQFVRDEEPESLTLEYKVSTALWPLTESAKSELAKDVSAMANAMGGIIIYGMEEDKHLHRAKGLDRGFDPMELSHERLDDLITSLISPVIPEIRIKRIPLNSTNPGRVAYAVQIPQGVTAHMALPRKQYFARRNFKAEPMADYEVRDVMGRQIAPKLRLRFWLGGVELPATGLVTVGIADRGDGSWETDWRVIIENESDVVVEYAFYQIVLSDNITPPLDVERWQFASNQDAWHDLTINRFGYRGVVPHQTPIWRGAPWTFVNGPLIISTPDQPDVEMTRYLIGYEVSAPHMSVYRQAWGAVRRVSFPTTLDVHSIPWM